MYLIFIFHYLDHPGPKSARPLFPLSLGETPLSGSVKVLRYKLLHCPARGRDLYVEVGKECWAMFASEFLYESNNVIPLLNPSRGRYFIGHYGVTRKCTPKWRVWASCPRNCWSESAATYPYRTFSI